MHALEPEVVVRKRHRQLWLFIPALAGIAVGTALAMRSTASPAPVAASEDACPMETLRATVARATAVAWMTASDRGVRIVPSVSDGRAVGFKLYGLRTGSPLESLGFRNGDTVHSIQGLPIDREPNVSEVWRRLNAPDLGEVTVELSRKGCPVTLLIRLV